MAYLCKDGFSSYALTETIYLNRLTKETVQSNYLLFSQTLKKFANMSNNTTLLTKFFLFGIVIFIIMYSYINI